MVGPRRFLIGSFPKDFGSKEKVSKIVGNYEVLMIFRKYVFYTVKDLINYLQCSFIFCFAYILIIQTNVFRTMMSGYAQILIIIAIMKNRYILEKRFFKNGFRLIKRQAECKL